jgi:hypothetical protein
VLSVVGSFRFNTYPTTLEHADSFVFVHMASGSLIFQGVLGLHMGVFLAFFDRPVTRLSVRFHMAYTGSLVVARFGVSLCRSHFD